MISFTEKHDLGLSMVWCGMEILLQSTPSNTEVFLWLTVWMWLLTSV